MADHLLDQDIRLDCVLPLSSIRLAAMAWGGAAGRPVLALHGWLDNAASFARLAPLLPDWRIVALDLAGHGHSEHRPAGYRYHLIDYVFDVIAAAEALGWSQFTVMGHSLGAAIAGLVAVALPERVERLLLIDGLGPLSEAAEQAPQRLRHAVAELSQDRRALRRYPDLHTLVLARQRATGLSYDAARVLIERATWRSDQGVMWRSDGRLRQTTPLYMTEPQVIALLSAIECPTTLVLANQGGVRQRPTLMERIAAIPQLHLIPLDGGHHLHLERASAVADVFAGAR